MIQLSHSHMTTGKTIALTRQTFVGKVMSLLFNMLSRLTITFLSRSKCLLISWLQSPSAVILEPPQNKVFHCFPICMSWSDGTGCHNLSFLNAEFYLALSLFFHLHQEALKVLFTFCHKDHVIYISEVIDISPCSLDSSCDSSSPAFCMMYSAYKLNKQDDNIQLYALLSQYGTCLFF